MQQRDHETSTKKRTRRSKKSHRGMAALKRLGGPCLLFGRRSTSGEIAERFFGCAVYRSNICDFRLPLEDTSGVASSSLQRGPISCKETPKFHYGKIRKSVNRLVASGASLYYCADCNDAVSVPHKDPVVGPLKHAAFRRPTHLIKAVLDDGGEAVIILSTPCFYR
ncbi:unnamed protein product [Toxocara canis]|uniref:Uncharacterized protein n=1 Tax=Toxocara canis TaxID=6265 RepID=A0A183VFB1_TOXCA|nr:unnamed protein product [Toxocara canis]